jgi:hypothetical protein
VLLKVLKASFRVVNPDLGEYSAQHTFGCGDNVMTDAVAFDDTNFHDASFLKPDR